MSELLQRGAKEVRLPVAAAKTAPPPEGVEPILAEVVRPDDPNARTPLDVLVPQLAGSDVEPGAPPPPPGARETALKRYFQGRQKLLAGDAAGAVEDLRAAAALDPGSGEPWRELGEAQLALGQRSEAIRSFRAAVAAGPADPRVLEFLGRNALERGDAADAARFLTRAARTDLAQADPGLERIILVELSRALALQGYIIGAIESLETALTRQTQVSASTRYGAELGAIFRRQGDLWRDVGDGYCRLGQYSDALTAYLRAAELPSLDRSPLRPRIVFAHMRAGRPSGAAAAVLEDIAGNQGRFGDGDVALLRYIADHGGDARAISRAMGGLKRVDGLTSPTLDRDLSLARASLLPPTSAPAAFRDHLGRFPSDIGVAVRLFNTNATASSAAAEAVAMVAERPDSAKVIAEALLRSRHDAGELLRALSSGRPAAALVRAHLVAKQGRFAEGLTTATGLSEKGSIGIASAAARVEFGLEAGAPDAANAALDRLKASRDPRGTRVQARCLFLTQRFREALDHVRPLLEGAAPSVSARLDDLVFAGDVAARLGRADDAERWLNDAVRLDPFDDRPLSLLMVLHSAGGAGADVAKLSRAVRELRESCPDSRTLRLLRAREGMRRSQWMQAETDLRKLVDEDPGDAGPIELLAAVWRERAKGDAAAARNARTWLDGHLQRRPQSPLLLEALAALEVSQGRAAEMEQPLREALAAGAGPDVSRILERLLREHLSRTAEADAMARARLADRARTVSESIEFADLSLRNREHGLVIAILHAGLAPDVDVTPDQARAALTQVGQCLREVQRADGGSTLADAIALFDRLATAVNPLPPDLHQRRLEAMAAAPGVSAERLLEATRLAVEQYPQLKSAPYRIVVAGLLQAGRGDVVAAFLAGAGSAVQLDKELLAEWYVAVVRHGGAADGKSLIEVLHTSGRLRTLFDNETDISRVRDLRAEAAYAIGTGFASVNKPADADAMYEFALSIDPRHAWACNNLGYALADRGVDLERASRLLETAFEERPNETPIMDSLAWLRYKQGIILDEVDAATGLIKRRGALSLLEAAVQTPQGQTDNTILDHLGDALWLAGRRDEAVQAWERTAEISTRMLEILRIRRDQPDADVADAKPAEPPDATPETAEAVECRAIIESTTRKREAAAAGGPVRVAPQVANPDPQPIAKPPGAARPGDAGRIVN